MRHPAARGCARWLSVALLLLISTETAAQQQVPPFYPPPAGGVPIHPAYTGHGQFSYESAPHVVGTDEQLLFAPPGLPAQPAGYMQPPEQTAPVEADPAQKKPAKHGRDGPYQGSSFSATWLTDSEFGMADLELREIWAFPFFIQESPLIITPGFGVHFLDGPTTTDLPPRLFDGYVQFRWLRQLTPRIGADVSVTPGIYSDFDRGRDESIRIAGRGISMIEWSPELKVALGVVYLDRNDVGLLPAAGVIWTPSPDARLELVFPRPRLALRYPFCGAEGASADETWYYLAGEFGGGSWAIQRVGGADDEVTYRDYRVVLGVEHKSLGRSSARWELAYVFGRELEYESAVGDFQPDDTLMLRLVLGD